MLHKALIALPKTLDETYAQILDHLPPVYLQDTIKLLQILAWSERPLRIEEAVDYLAVELDSEGCEAGFDEDNRLPVPKEIVRFCSSLVTVVRTSEYTRKYRESTPRDVREQYRSREELRLAHYSVKEYLTSGRCQIDEFRFHLDQATSATYIASALLTYLLQLQTDLPKQAIILRFPLTLYSASHWLEFARVAKAEDTCLQNLIDILLLTPERFAHWSGFFRPDRPWQPDPNPPFRLAQPLYYASLGGLEHVADRLLKSGADINSRGDRYDNALQAAAAHGLENMVNLLLQKGADVNAHRGEASTLQVASREGHVRVVQSLLAHGADVNAKGGKYSGIINALQAACFGGHLEVAKLLLDSGADVNIRGGRSGSALQIASRVGNDGIVQLLLEEGANINAPAIDDCLEALESTFDGAWYSHRAWYPHQNHENVVLLLLGRCDDVGVKDKRFADLLPNAAGAGFEHVVKRLLVTDLEIIAGEARRTDVNAQGEVCGRALRAASRKGHDNIVQLLLDRCPDVTVLGGWYSRALEAASEAGQVNIVQTLLSRRSEVIAECGVYGSALATASGIGHDDIVQMLLDKGADVNFLGGWYSRALEAALKAGHVTTVQILLQNTISTGVGGTINASVFDIAFNSRYTDVLETLLKRLYKENVADEHGWSSEAYLVICRGLTSGSMSRQHMWQNTITFGQAPSRFVGVVPNSDLSFSSDGLEITRGMLKYCNI